MWRSQTWWLAVALGLSAIGADARAGAVSIWIAPERAFDQQRVPESSLVGEGTVLFYREGEYKPAVVAGLGQPVALDRGRWWWRAEAESLVTIDRALVEVDDQGRATCPTQVWPAVSACRLELPEAAFRGLSRIDILSLDRPVVTPLVASRPFGWVPAGEFVPYSVGPRGLVAVGRVESCRPGEHLAISAPEPETADQAVMVHVDIDSELARSPELSVTVEGLTAAPVAPFAEVAIGPRHTSLFRIRGPVGSGRVVIHHPQLRTLRQPILGRPGSALELAPVMPAPRATAQFDVQYVPIGEARSAELRLVRCPMSFLAPDDLLGLEISTCEEAGSSPVDPGISAVRFGRLDTGTYVPVLAIGDEVVPGAGEYSWIDLPATGPDPDPIPLQLLEFRIAGRLTRAGKPEEGQIGLVAPAGSRLQSRRFATSPDGHFSITYLGRRIPEYFARFLPDEVSEATHGLPGAEAQVELCSGKRCSRWTRGSWILGSSEAVELAIPVGLDTVVRVLDAETLAPIGGAVVSVPPSAGERSHPHRFLWRDAVISLGDEHGSSSVFPVNREGVVSLQLWRPGVQSIRIGAEGYASREIEVEMGFHEVRLRREQSDHSGIGAIRFVLHNGEAASRAVVLVARAGRLEPACSGVASPEGIWAWRSGCEREGAALLILHEQSALEVFDDVEAGTELALDPLPSPPGRIRLVDPDGEPLAGVLVDVEVAGVSWRAGLLLANQLSGGRVPYRTDREGLVPLTGASTARVGVDAIHLGWSGEKIRLPRPAPGEDLDFIVQRPPR